MVLGSVFERLGQYLEPFQATTNSKYSLWFAEHPISIWSICASDICTIGIYVGYLNPLDGQPLRSQVLRSPLHLACGSKCGSHRIEVMQ